MKQTAIGGMKLLDAYYAHQIYTEWYDICYSLFLTGVTGLWYLQFAIPDWPMPG
jgi:hypothetical protein